MLLPIDDGRWYTSGWLAEQTRGAPIEAMHEEHRRAAMALRRAVPAARWFGFDSGGGDPEYLCMANEVHSFETAIDWMTYRERLMHERVAKVATQRVDDRIGLMAGGTHLARDDATVDAPGLLPAGGGRVPEHRSLRHALPHRPAGADHLDVARRRTHHGVALRLGPAGDLTVPDDTLNAALAQRWNRPCLIVTHGDDVERRVAGMNNLTMSCRLGEQADAIIFCPRVTPARVDGRSSA